MHWFRKKAPPAPEPLSRVEADTLCAWGLSLLDWRDMPDNSRAWYRDNLTRAPHFTP